VEFVPPFAIANVPASVTAPEVAVFGVKPVVPALKVVTPLDGAAAHVGTPKASVRMYPFVPAARNVVAPDPVWYGIEPFAPPAKFVAVVADPTDKVD
jgi:hypothetical protein